MTSVAVSMPSIQFASSVVPVPAPAPLRQQRQERRDAARAGAGRDAGAFALEPGFDREVREAELGGGAEARVRVGVAGPSRSAPCAHVGRTGEQNDEGRNDEVQERGTRIRIVVEPLVSDAGVGVWSLRRPRVAQAGRQGQIAARTGEVSAEKGGDSARFGPTGVCDAGNQRRLDCSDADAFATRRTSSAWLDTPDLLNTRLSCVRTVSMPTPRRSATSLSRAPDATSRATSASASVQPNARCSRRANAQASTPGRTPAPAPPPVPVEQGSRRADRHERDHIGRMRGSTTDGEGRARKGAAAERGPRSAANELSAARGRRRLRARRDVRRADEPSFARSTCSARSFARRIVAAAVGEDVAGRRVLDRGGRGVLGLLQLGPAAVDAQRLRQVRDQQRDQLHALGVGHRRPARVVERRSALVRSSASSVATTLWNRS